MKILSFALIVVGVVWAMALYWAHLVMTGMAELMPLSSWSIATLVRTALELMGPVLLICGPIFVLIGFHRRLGSIVALLGCLLLTAFVVDTMSDLSSGNWSDAKGYLPMFAFLTSIALLCDVGAIRLYQLVSISLSKVVS